MYKVARQINELQEQETRAKSQRDWKRAAPANCRMKVLQADSLSVTNDGSLRGDRLDRNVGFRAYVHQGID